MKIERQKQSSKNIHRAVQFLDRESVLGNFKHLKNVLREPLFQENEDIDVFVGQSLDCFNDSYPNSTFDAVIFHDTTNYDKYILSAFEKILRTLKPGGKLLFIDRNSDVIMGLLLQAGFDDVGISWLPQEINHIKRNIFLASKAHLGLV